MKNGVKTGNSSRHAVFAMFVLTGGLACLALVFPLFSGSYAEAQRKRKPAAVAKTPVKKATPKPVATAVPTPLKFPHAIHSTDCADCHKFPTANWKSVRASEPFPDIADYPKHESCLSCHREQFFSGSTPQICTICHTNPSPGDSSRHPFPNPRDVFDKSPKAKTATPSFVVSFPHSKHLELVGSNRKAVKGTMFVNVRMNRRATDATCAICHQTHSPQGDSSDEYFTKPPEKLGDAFWLKKGTFKTAPRDHAGCFTCHSEESGLLPAPADCATCHKPIETTGLFDFDKKLADSMGISDRIVLDAWQRRRGPGAFRHEFSSHAEMSCADCHKSVTEETVKPNAKRVEISSCNMCHITETLDDGGVLNYEIDMRRKDSKFQCVKCHVTLGREAIPESHLKAIGGK